MEQLANPARRRLFRGRMSSKPEMRLPWVTSEQDFLAKCTQCQACIEHCETQIIVKDELGYPKVDFSIDECTHCKKCIEVCEQPLFKNEQQIATQAPWSIQFMINKNCFAENNVFCQSCRDVCDSRAIKFDPFSASIPTPTLNNEDCTQCGACIPVCPQNAINTRFISEEING